MDEKTIVLRKEGHWYVITSHSGDEKEILLTLLEYSEKQKYDIKKEEVLDLIDKLGWRVEVYGKQAG